MWRSRVTVISCEGAGICGCAASRHSELRRFIEAARSAGRCPAGGGWMDIVAELRGFEIDHEPDGWPGVRMRQISALCDETDRLRDMLRPEWNEEGEAMTLASAAEDADEWLALIERLHNVWGRAVICGRVGEVVAHHALAHAEAPSGLALRHAGLIEQRPEILRARIASLGAEAEATEREIALAARADTPALTEAWASLASCALALDEAARLAMRQLVADTFERLVIYHRSARPDESDGRTIDLILIAKGGATRLLRVDRRTGEWRAGEDWAGHA